MRIPTYKITWELLPDDFVFDDEPVDNVNQPPLAAALTESLALAEQLPDEALVTTNYDICATLSDRMVVKAPDWASGELNKWRKNGLLRRKNGLLRSLLSSV